jgi:hypothetical protein
MVLAALVVRLLVVAFVFRDQTDPTNHHAQFGWEMGWVARSIVQGHGFSSPFFPATGPTALMPPLFPCLLAGVFHIFGLYTSKAALAILSINSLFSALTCIPIYFSTRYSLGNRLSVLAGWVWVVYPFAIYFSADRIWDYSLTCLLFTTCFLVARRLHGQRHHLAWLGFGALYGVTALSNPSVLSMFPVFLVLAIVRIRRLKGRWVLNNLAAVLGLFVVLAPWMVRNYRVLRVVTPVRDNFWLEFWPGNNGNTFESNDHLARPPSGSVELQRFVLVGERSYLDQVRARSVNFIRHHPFQFIEHSLHRAVCYWTGYWSLSSAYLRDQPTEIPNIFLTITITLFMLRGARRFWDDDKTVALPYLATIAVFPLTYYATHVIPDYRQPIEPEIVVMVVAGALSLRDRLTIDKVAEGEERLTVMVTA